MITSDVEREKNVDALRQHISEPRSVHRSQTSRCIAEYKEERQVSKPSPYALGIGTYMGYTLSLLALLTPVFSLANSLDNPLRFTTIEQFLVAVLNVIVTIAFPIIILFIVFIGFKFIAAQGNAEKLKEVRQYFFWAIVGALIILGAQALSLAIQGTVTQLSQGI